MKERKGCGLVKMNPKTVRLLSCVLAFSVLFCGCGKARQKAPVSPTPAFSAPSVSADITLIASPTVSPSPIVVIPPSDCPDCSHTLSYFIDDTPVFISSDNAELPAMNAELGELLADSYRELGCSSENGGFFYINNTHGNLVELTDRQAAFVALGLQYCERCGGAFDITDEPLRELWQVDSESFTVPTEEQVAEALLRCDYRGILLNEGMLYYTNDDTFLNTDSYLAGYCIDSLVPALRESGCTHAHLSIGDTTYYFEPEGQAAPVTLYVPNGESEDTIGSVHLGEYAVTALHVKESCIEQDGLLCHPITDIRSGYPSAMGFSSVFVFSPSAAVAEIIAKACYSCSVEEGNTMLSEIDDTYAIYVMDDGSIFCTDGLTDRFDIRFNVR